MTPHPLEALGWTAHFTNSLTPEEAALPALRLTALHRGRVETIGCDGAGELLCPPNMPVSLMAVGDWVLADGPRVGRILPRVTLLQRRAAGTGTETQLIAANVDTMFITTSCNADFNAARLERYLVLAHSAGIEPVILLTKADQADAAPYLATARALSADVTVLALNAKSPETAALLAPWVGPGQTVVLLGSSGVGKSTIANSLGRRAKPPVAFAKKTARAATPPRRATCCR